MGNIPDLPDALIFKILEVAEGAGPAAVATARLVCKEAHAAGDTTVMVQASDPDLPLWLLQTMWTYTSTYFKSRVLHARWVVGIDISWMNVSFLSRIRLTEPLGPFCGESHAFYRFAHNLSLKIHQLLSHTGRSQQTGVTTIHQRDLVCVAVVFRVQGHCWRCGCRHLAAGPGLHL